MRGLKDCRAYLVLSVVCAFTLGSSTGFLLGARSRRPLRAEAWCRRPTKLLAGKPRRLGEPATALASPSVSTTTSTITGTDPLTGVTTTVVTTVTTITAPPGSLVARPPLPAIGAAAEPSTLSPMAAMAQAIAELPDYGGGDDDDDAAAVMNSMLAMSQMMAGQAEATEPAR